MVSGGAKGADTFAETGWRRLGGAVISYRAQQTAFGSFGVMKYELRDNPPAQVWDLTVLGHPTWEQIEGALFYRTMIVADECERCVAFWNGRSAGTRNTIDLFKGRGKPVHLMEV